MEASSVANQDEAMKCRDIGLAALDDKNYDKALKFFKKSSQMFQLDGINELINKVEMLKAKQDQGDSSSTGGDRNSPKTHSTSTKNNGTETPKPSGGSSKTSSGNSTPKAATSSSSTSNNSNSNNSNTTSTGSTTRGYTDEQEAGAKRILAQSKKSHYECLGVSKTATEDEIKRAYKKLALKFHPDKNSAPSAEGAFKAINSAVECLSDASKREIYDQYGTDNPQNMAGGGFPGGGFPGGGFHFPQGAFRGQGVHEINPEEIFNLFFQGGMGAPGGFRTQFRTFPQQRGRHFNQQDRQDNDSRNNGGNSSMISQILQFLPMILLFLMMGNFGGSSQQSVRPYTWSKNPTYGYKYEITTTNGAIVYANEDFYSEYSRRKRRDTHYNIFKEIDRQYLTHLSEQCAMNPNLCYKKHDFICTMNPSSCSTSKKGTQNAGGSTANNPSHSKRSDEESEF